jgi:hypothetical protein
MRRLRSLSEAECYMRLYGDHDPTVQAVKLPPRPSRYASNVSGEDLRRALEERIDERLSAEAAEAA